MRQLTLIVLLVAACKQQLAVTLTESSRLGDEVASKLALQRSFSLGNFDILISDERKLAGAIAKGHSDVRVLQLQHQVRSVIAYAVHSRCFKAPDTNPKLKELSYREHNSPRRHNHRRYERDWYRRYDFNYYIRDSKHRLVIDDQRLCSILLTKLMEFTPEWIDLAQPNTKFFAKVMANKVRSLNSTEMRAAKQRFYREELLPKILQITEQSMAQAQQLFPFYLQDYTQACAAQRDYIELIEEGAYHYRYSQAVRNKIDCSTLKQLPRAKPTLSRSRCATARSFSDMEALFNVVKTTIEGMNTARAELDRLVKLREKEPYKDRFYAPHVEKQPWILSFMKVLNVTEFNPDSATVKAYDSYTGHLLEAAKCGILPLIFARVTQKEMGSVHLNHMGKFFGFGKVEYKALRLPSRKTLQQALGEMQRELAAYWVMIQAKRVRGKDVKEYEIYKTVLNHEIAVAQLLLQDPSHVVVIDHLMRDFQYDPLTPKWLRKFKEFTVATEVAFIPISLQAGFVTGGVGTIPVLLIANAFNFLWVGKATAEMVVARNRYRLIERALLTGNSEQYERGMKVLHAFHERRRDMIASGTVGVPLTIKNLTIIVKGIGGIKTIGIDIVAGISSDIETITMPAKTRKSESDLHRNK